VFCGLLFILNSIYAFFLIKVKDKKNNKTCVIATTAPPHNWPTKRSQKNTTIKENNYNRSVAKL
jgi:hypothetical protein